MVFGLKGRAKVCLGMSLAVFSLSGCGVTEKISDYIAPSKYMFYSGEDVNLIEMNYAAADYIAGQARNNLNRATPVLTGILTPSQNPDVTSEFGRLIPEQIGARFSQLGYIVKPQPRDDGLPKPEIRRHALLAGTYIYSESDLSVTINLRLIDSETGQIIGAHDYILPVNKEINDMLQVKPTAIRMTPS